MIDSIYDLSHWDTVTNEAAFLATSPAAVIHKATYTDHMLWGAYHFLDNLDGARQADHFLSVVQPDGTFLLALDFESGTVAQAEAFAQFVHDKTGVWPLLYTRASYVTQQIGSKPTLLSNCPLWVASYRDTPLLPPQWSTWAIHQYTNGTDGPEPHHVTGIVTVDRNRFDGDAAALKAFWRTCCGHAVIQPEIVTRWVNTQLLNVRSTPDLSSPRNIIGQLPHNAQVQINGAAIRNGFVPMTQPVSRLQGWLWANYLTDVSPAPVTPQPVPVLPVITHSKLSFHYQPGGNNNSLLDILKSCHDNGRPIPGMLLMRYGWSGELTPAQVKDVSPSTEIMLRPWQQSEAQPDWSKSDLYGAGRALPPWCQHDPDVDFWQTINEPAYGPGTASYWQGALDEANARGVKLAVGCFATGNPKLPREDQTWWNTFYPILRRCKAERHAFMLHQYLIPDPGTKDWTNQWGILRHKLLYQDLPADLQDLPLRIGEFGTAYATKSFSSAEYLSGVMTADSLMRGDPVRWAALATGKIARLTARNCSRLKRICWLRRLR